MKKILVLQTYPRNDPSSRHRIYAYVPSLNKDGYYTKIDVLFPNAFYKIKNKKGAHWTVIKSCFLLLLLIRRLVCLPRVWFFDVVIIQREAFPFFTPVVEKAVRWMAKRIIFDFDDAIFTKPEKWTNWRDLLRDPSQVSQICAVADHVIVGSSYLKHYAEKFNHAVEILPTVYKVSKDHRQNDRNPLVIGWIGSWTTLINLDILKPVLIELRKKYEFVFHVIGADNVRTYQIDGVAVKTEVWSLEKEEDALASFDIGVMPLYDSVWEKGKCGFKLIQYMALGKPVVASPVGENQFIVEHGVNGFLASSDSEWVEYLGTLLADNALRVKMGKSAKRISDEKYSYAGNYKKLVGIIENVSA